MGKVFQLSQIHVSGIQKPEKRISRKIKIKISKTQGYSIALVHINLHSKISSISPEYQIMHGVV